MFVSKITFCTGRRRVDAKQVNYTLAIKNLYHQGQEYGYAYGDKIIL